MLLLMVPIVGLCLGGAAHSQNSLELTATEDLDGDGAKDEIRLTARSGRYGYGPFTLHVNDVAIEGRGDNLDERISVVDIDTTDIMREIAISESGPSDDHATHFFAFDGFQIIPLGELPGSDELRIDGSGVVRSQRRGRILGTWYTPVTYRLTKEHRLEEISQAFYEMNISTVLRADLPLLSDRGEGAHLIGVIHAGARALLLRTDEEAWCEIESESGTRGWFRVCRDVVGQTAHHVLSLPIAD
jgi:hypothetical protein